MLKGYCGAAKPFTQFGSGCQMQKDTPVKRGRPSLGQRLLGLETKDYESVVPIKPKYPYLANLTPPPTHPNTAEWSEADPAYGA